MLKWKHNAIPYHTLFIFNLERMWPMTTFEALSLLAQFSLTIVAVLTLIVTIVVFLTKKK